MGGADGTPVGGAEGGPAGIFSSVYRNALSAVSCGKEN